MLIKYLRFNCLINGISPCIVNLGSQLGIGAMLDSCADFFYPMFLRGGGIQLRGSIVLLSKNLPSMGFLWKGV